MLKYLFILLLLPCCLPAQKTNPVIPVESPDYLDLIQRDSTGRKDSLRTPIHSFNRANLVSVNSWVLINSKVADARISGDRLTLYPVKYRHIGISGLFSTSFEALSANHQPALQKTYVQGRKINGSPRWHGPELNEDFSFGPAANTLEFDGTNYPYDLNGALVPAGSGNGTAARAYNNSVLRTGSIFSQLLNIQGNYYVNHSPVIKTKIVLGNINNTHILDKNKSSSQNAGINIQTTILPLTINGSYSYQQTSYSNSNRNGFLNRVYQQSLITPISFQNSQGILIGNEQRRYSNTADNPGFLLADNGNSLRYYHHNGGLQLSKRIENISLSLNQSIQHSEENSNEGYKAGSAAFPAGLRTNRTQRDNNYFLRAEAQLQTDYASDRFESKISAAYSLSAATTRIGYEIHPSAYRYNRNVQEVELNYKLSYRSNRFFNAGLEAGNKFYMSSTTSDKVFLPRIAGYAEFRNINDWLYIRVSSSLTRFNSELPLNNSFAYVGLLQTPVSGAQFFFPLTEVSGFGGLRPIQHRDWNLNTEFRFNNRVMLTIEYFSRLRKDDIFPAFDNSELVLHNMASHTNKGMEFSVQTWKRWGRDKLQVYGSASLTTWRSKVTEVLPGFENTPIAGFSDVHKIIAEGHPLGAIAGSAYLRDAAGNRVIGADGFPLVDNQRRIIANPIPDFIAKLNSNFDLRNWSMTIDWEWRKGGQAWNGTQAALDYYGRSASTGEFRNTTGYIFPGVLENGQPNNTPVAFYDNTVPVTQNRWTRYGMGGINEEYIQSTDQVRVSSLALSRTLQFKKNIRELSLSAYITNLVIWSAYKGVDPGIRTLFDQAASTGLDYFNLPAFKTFGVKASIQF